MQMQEKESSVERAERWRQRIWTTIRAARTDPTFLAAAARYTTIDCTLLPSLGWRALHEERSEDALHYFRAAIHHDPYAISAWVGLSRVVNQQQERRAALQAALDLHHLVTYLRD